MQAEHLPSGDLLSCDYRDFPLEVDFLHPLAGIACVKPPEESKIDVKASKRLNRLYVELLKTNPDWDTDARGEELNHFSARLIFGFFAEDTGIFDGIHLFTGTLERMTDRDGCNTALVPSGLFQAMNAAPKDRPASPLRPWALRFEYVNGNLFSGSTQTPRYSKIARSYLLGCGRDLNWKLINPDIFGPMIQAVADDEERGTLGMHYTSVPNIVKVLNPLFLDDLRLKLAEAGDSPIKLLNATRDPTYLLADVDVVAEYKLANINRRSLEALLHKVFATARLNVELKDRFGSQVEPREWFFVPLAAINDAIRRIRDRSVSSYRYDKLAARVVRCDGEAPSASPGD